MLPKKDKAFPGLTFAAAFAVAFALFGATTASATHTHFIDDNCMPGTNPVFLGNGITRYQALGYAYHGVLEGYEWGGGCWNDDNVDESPGDPPGVLYQNGEGGDCSGFVFKSWFESLDGTDGRFWWWHILKDIHGPYNTTAFKHGDGVANFPYPKASVIPMDAFASATHMGLLLVPNDDGTDEILEARGEAYGTNIWTEAYHMRKSFGGVRRTGWSG